jgi:hypothetical protein
MIAMVSVFWVMLILFAIIGMLRGWAKEIVATAGIVLALFALNQFGAALFSDSPVNFASSEDADDLINPDTLTDEDIAQHANEFMVRMVFFLGVTFFAYQTPAAAALWSSRQGGGESGRRFELISEGLQQRILGFIIGFVNGWLVVGAVWNYAEELYYPFGRYVIRPEQLELVNVLGESGALLQQTTMTMINALPMTVLGKDDLVLPLLVVILFLFVIIVMI